MRYGGLGLPARSRVFFDQEKTAVHVPLNLTALTRYRLLSGTRLDGHLLAATRAKASGFTVSAHFLDAFGTGLGFTSRRSSRWPLE